MIDGKEVASKIKFLSDYAKWNFLEDRTETWKDSTNRVMGTHLYNPKLKEAFKNKEFVDMYDHALKLYEKRSVLASQRALQFADNPILAKNARLYNCAATYIDRPRVFQEIMWMLLCGGGVGYSIQYKDVNKLPAIRRRYNGTTTFTIPDSIEGWSDAIGVLMSSFFINNQTFPEYAGFDIKFDYSEIREKGSFISGGFKAPGPDGLKQSLERIENLLNDLVYGDEVYKLSSLNCHDIICHAADAVISGGVRRSALIALFDMNDSSMIEAKIGNWYSENPQRARANNSAYFIEGKYTKSDLMRFKEYIRQFGEPGFIFSKNDRFVFNPCAEIGFMPISPITGESGFGWCNLTEINGAQSNTPEFFYEQCKAAAFIGTVQASYTDVGYLTQATKEIIEHEALLGVSITGWMNNPNTLFNPEVLKKGAAIVKEVNERTAAILGINPAARLTCVKPSGNASVLLGCASGIHPEHSKRYFRLMQINKENDIVKYIKENAPSMVEHSVWSSTGADDVVYVPIRAPEQSINKSDLNDIEFLDYVKLVKENWVDSGNIHERSLHPDLSHNVSNTVSVHNWDNVFNYLWENSTYFSGISLMAETGDKAYNQAPFTAVLTEQEILDTYGVGAIFASGLIVDGLHLFDNLWEALDMYVKKRTKFIARPNEVLLMRDWVRRVKQFARRYTNNDLNLCCDLLLDVNNLHKWHQIERELKILDLEELNIKPDFLDVGTTAAMACYGGSCNW